MREFRYEICPQSDMFGRCKLLWKYRFSESSVLRDGVFVSDSRPCVIVAGLSDVSAEIDKNRSVNLVVL